MKFEMTCSCGDVMGVEAENREEAVTKMQGTMTQEAIGAHMTEKHPSDPAMTVEACHAQIANDLKEVA